MADTQKKPASQILRETAIQEQKAELGKNDYKENSDEYSFTSVPEEIDGAETERTKLSVMNQFTEEEGYTNPDGE